MIQSTGTPSGGLMPSPLLSSLEELSLDITLHREPVAFEPPPTFQCLRVLRLCVLVNDVAACTATLDALAAGIATCGERLRYLKLIVASDRTNATFADVFGRLLAGAAAALRPHRLTLRFPMLPCPRALEYDGDADSVPDPRIFDAADDLRLDLSFIDAATAQAFTARYVSTRVRKRLEYGVSYWDPGSQSLHVAPFSLTMAADVVVSGNGNITRNFLETVAHCGPYPELRRLQIDNRIDVTNLTGATSPRRRTLLPRCWNGHPPAVRPPSRFLVNRNLPVSSARIAAACPDGPPSPTVAGAADARRAGDDGIWPPLLREQLGDAVDFADGHGLCRSRRVLRRHGTRPLAISTLSGSST